MTPITINPPTLSGMRSVLQAFTHDLIMTCRSVRRYAGRLIGAAGLALVTSACLQPSLNPLFLPEDFTFDERLAGTWKCGDEVWTFARETDKDLGDKPYYGIKVQKGNKTGELGAFLGRLDGHLFITFHVTTGPELATPFIERHLVGAHTFGRVTIEPAKVTLAMLDADWIDEREKAGLLTIGTRRPLHDDVILTAAPADLQRFVRTYADDREAFGERVELVRQNAEGGSCYSEK